MSLSFRLPCPIRPSLIALFQFACLALVAGVPETLPFQGRVSIDGVPFTGTGQFKFALLTTSSAVVWGSAADTNPADGEPDIPVTLAVSKGLYSVLLGQGMVPLAATLFSTDGDLRLRVWFNDGTHGFQRLDPDQPLGSVAYALRSQSAAGADVAQLAQSVANGAILESTLANNAVSSLKLASDPASLAKVSAGVLESTAGNLKVNPGTLYGLRPSDSFLYDSKPMGHYALAWMEDHWHSGGPTLWLSGYGGLKFFSRGALAMSIDTFGSTLIRGDTFIGDNPATPRFVGITGRVFLEDSSPSTALDLKNSNGRWWSLISIGTGPTPNPARPPGSFAIVDSTANAVRMLISPSGHVGIGVANPDAPLSIRRDSANSLFGYCLTLADRDGTPWWKLGAANGGNFSIGAAGLRDYDISISRSSGNVGIGATPYSDRKLRVAGDASVGGDLHVAGAGYSDDGFWLSSDSRLKTQVDRIEGALARVDALRGVSFHWRQDTSEHPRPKGRQIGFIAQEVATVLPELVHTNADGYLSVNYDGVAPVLVEAVHEMKQQFDAHLAEKNAEIQGLQTRLSQLESAMASLLNRVNTRPDNSPDH